MNSDIRLEQIPACGTTVLLFQGDTITFTLIVNRDVEGHAWVRTSLGHAKIARREAIEKIEIHKPPPGKDWYDFPMEKIDASHFRITLPLVDVGHFGAKCFLMEKGKTEPIWPFGDNTVINVEPASACCANIIYNAFVRQFGPNKKEKVIPAKEDEKCIEKLDKTSYSVIPPSGTFRDFISELDFIIGSLGCRIIQLLPITPTPTTFGRMGRFGSPYAALSFTDIDRALAVFDPRITPLEQFIELVDAVHSRSAIIIIDIAINHTGWGAILHEIHPEWLARDEEGKIEVPGAWGVRWEDLTRLDYSHEALWRYMADVFLVWCRRGVDGFRCDAGYMIPTEVWKYIIAVVREQYPDTIFFLEGLGGKISVTEELLEYAGFDWAYSELFQNYTRAQIENYLPGATAISQTKGLMVHFAETHDNDRLAARSKTYARMRTALCALCSKNGAFGFANGVEWFATEKIDVHDANSLNWGAPDNQVLHIRRINAILRVHPCFQGKTSLTMLQEGDGNNIVLWRQHLPSKSELLIVANLDDQLGNTALWKVKTLDTDYDISFDLLSGREVSLVKSKGMYVRNLNPGEVLCLSPNSGDIHLIEEVMEKPFSEPEKLRIQRLKTKALEVFKFYRGMRDLGSFSPESAVQALAEDPVAFCKGFNSVGDDPKVVIWQWPRDLRREVMIPPGHFLLVRSDYHFEASVLENGYVLTLEKSLRAKDGTFFILFIPLDKPLVHHRRTMKLIVYEPRGTKHTGASLLFLTSAKNARVKQEFDRESLLQIPLLFLDVNGRGGMSRTNVFWERINSRYDALLAANLSDEFPEDRRIMFTRCRAWAVFQSYSHEINSKCLERFSFDYHSGGYWLYRVPVGQGEHILLFVTIEMAPLENEVRIVFNRLRPDSHQNCLPDHRKIKIILRPDIEDRSFHENTKAYLGPERLFPASVTQNDDGYVFSPYPDHRLEMHISSGIFVMQPEWHYMVHRPLEAERGLDPDSDLFSPGYFSSLLEGGQKVILTARALTSKGKDNGENGRQQMENEGIRQPPLRETGKGYGLEKALERALDAYIVKRGKLKSVIAGYPWFLDWGRDSLIFSRGLIASGRTEDAKAILKLFGSYEEQGTLPNMIHGNEAGNRDTSDAPLWFLVTSSDLLKKAEDANILNTMCGERSLREVAFSIAHSLVAGTPNGIKMDPESCLLFSPEHFTWMDTNDPAGTPREGYPIEIQALWYAALMFLSEVDEGKEADKWREIAEGVRRSIKEFFWLEEEGYLSDCLHTGSGKPAAQAEADNALRPNQLLVITLGVLDNPEVCRSILDVCQELLVPGAIRSLADRPVSYSLPIVHGGHVIGDPNNPYRGTYAGDESTMRKPAYHNGTAWTWLFPSFCEAWNMVYGNSGRETALNWLASCTWLMNRGCIGHLPEITDGDFPHKQRGCDAQAWGVSEALRVYKKLI